MNKFNAAHYKYSVQWSQEDEAFIGRVAEFESLAADGPSPAKALDAIQTVVAEVLEDLAEKGESIPVPFAEREYSGKFNLRVPPAVHRKLVEEAAEEGVSLNALVLAKVAG